MEKKKNISTIVSILVLIFIVVVLISCIMNFINSNWPKRFKSELDQFFGKGNWESISEETKESIIYTKYISVRSAPYLSEEVPGKYTDWNIKFTNKNGDDEIWKITNHALKINNDKYGIFSSKRYSNKQALVLELMDISCGLAADEVLNDIVKDELSENEADCLRVSISYNGGNPKPEFYDELFKQSWFNVKDVTAENFLACDLHDFYIDIFAFDYKVEKLTEQEQQNLFDSMESIERKLLQEYGENASFEIYFDKGHQVEYIDGVKQ